MPLENYRHQEEPRKMSRLYYEPPTEEVFNEVKQKCIELWQTYDDAYGYASEKVNGIKDLKNIQDNVMSMIARFDHINMAKLAEKLSPEARKAIRERILDGGNLPEHIPF